MATHQITKSQFFPFESLRLCAFVVKKAALLKDCFAVTPALASAPAQV